MFRVKISFSLCFTLLFKCVSGVFRRGRLGAARGVFVGFGYDVWLRGRRSACGIVSEASSRRPRCCPEWRGSLGLSRVQPVAASRPKAPDGESKRMPVKDEGDDPAG